MPMAPHLAALCLELGLPVELILARGLLPVAEPDELLVAEVRADGVPQLLTPTAAAAWWRLQQAARLDGIELSIVSAFRSIARQTEIVRRKREAGLSAEAILAFSAPPGFSEHHSGCAVDVTTPGCPPLEHLFEDTPAFAWLLRHAADFGFVLSYPPGNPLGFEHEPWHWCFRGLPEDGGVA